MIKLKSLYNEIKLIDSSMITPKMVKRLWIDLLMSEQSEEDGRERWSVLYSIISDYYPLYDNFESLSKNQLNRLYIELYKLKQKRNINEIRLYPKITPEMVEELCKKIESEEESEDWWEKYLNILDKYDVASDWDNEVDINKLKNCTEINNLYKNLLQLKKKRNINEIRLINSKIINREQINKLIDNYDLWKHFHWNTEKGQKLDKIFRKPFGYYSANGGVVSRDTWNIYLEFMHPKELENLYRDLLTVI